MKKLILFSALVSQPVVGNKAKFIIPIVTAGAAIGGCAVGYKHYEGKVSGALACKHMDFISYSSRDTDQTQHEVQSYNKLYARLCWDYLPKEDQEIYRPVLEE